MKPFILHLQDATHDERFDSVASFVGQDTSGLFGILADHARTMTMLVFGLSRFRMMDGTWRSLALAGGLLYFVDNELSIVTRRYLRYQDYDRISLALDQQLVAEEAALHTVKESLHRLEEEMFKRLWKIGRQRVL